MLNLIILVQLIKISKISCFNQIFLINYYNILQKVNREFNYHIISIIFIFIFMSQYIIYDIFLKKRKQNLKVTYT